MLWVMILSDVIRARFVHDVCVMPVMSICVVDSCFWAHVCFDSPEMSRCFLNLLARSRSLLAMTLHVFWIYFAWLSIRSRYLIIVCSWSKCISIDAINVFASRTRTRMILKTSTIVRKHLFCIIANLSLMSDFFFLLLTCVRQIRRRS
jgi:hypothetical protein